jgi:hypothetical protein
MVGEKCLLLKCPSHEKYEMVLWLRMLGALHPPVKPS